MYAKFDINYRGERGRATALYDSGADISVISISYLKTLFPNCYKNIMREIRVNGVITFKDGVLFVDDIARLLTKPVTKVGFLDDR